MLTFYGVGLLHRPVEMTNYPASDNSEILQVGGATCLYTAS